MRATCSLEWLFTGYRIPGRLHLLVVYSHFSRYGTTAGQYWLEKAVFRFSAPPSPTTVSPVLVSCTSPCCIQALYPKEFQCPMSGAEFQWFSPPLILSKFLRELNFCVLCPSPQLVQEVPDWKSNPPPKYLFSIQVGGALFNHLMFILRLLAVVLATHSFAHYCCKVFPKYLQGWISGEWGSVSTSAPIVATRR